MTVPLEVPGWDRGVGGVWMWVWSGRVLMGCKLAGSDSRGTRSSALSTTLSSPWSPLRCCWFGELLPSCRFTPGRVDFLVSDALIPSSPST